MDQVSQQVYHAMNKPVMDLLHLDDLERIAYDAKKNQVEIVNIALGKLITIQKLEEDYYLKKSSRDNCYSDRRPVLTKQLQESKTMLEKLERLLKHC